MQDRWVVAIASMSFSYYYNSDQSWATRYSYRGSVSQRYYRRSDLGAVHYHLSVFLPSNSNDGLLFYFLNLRIFSVALLSLTMEWPTRVVSLRVVSCRVVSCRVVSCRVVCSMRIESEAQMV